MKSFRDYLAEQAIEYLVVQLPGCDLTPDVQRVLLNEGRWAPAGTKDWMLRVDAENPSIKGQRHVHIAREKYVNTKNMQAAWNQDATRHDKASFNDKVGSQAAVQDIARKALGLGDDVVLEAMTQSAHLLLESTDSIASNAPVTPYYLRARIP
jgi:hypothetical protein